MHNLKFIIVTIVKCMISRRLAHWQCGTMWCIATCLVLEHSSPGKETLYLLSNHFPSPQPPATTDPDSVSVDWSTLHTSCKRNHGRRGFLGLVSFTSHHVFEIHPCRVLIALYRWGNWKVRSLSQVVCSPSSLAWAVPHLYALLTTFGQMVSGRKRHLVTVLMRWPCCYPFKALSWIQFYAISGLSGSGFVQTSKNKPYFWVSSCEGHIQQWQCRRHIYPWSFPSSAVGSLVRTALPTFSTDSDPARTNPHPPNTSCRCLGIHLFKKWP